jgi:hypothetical protein
MFMTFKRRLVSTIHKSLYFLLVFASFVLLNARFVPSSTNQIAAQSRIADERKAQIEHSSHMPEATTVSISAIRNLQSEQWHRDLEIEVQNNSGKPIYYLEIVLSFPEIDATGEDGVPRHYTFPLTFGRRELMKRGNYAASTDTSVNPGEKNILRISEPYSKGLETFLSKKNIAISSIKKLRVRIYSVSFGDGTGFKMGRPLSSNQSSITPSLPRNQPRKGLSILKNYQNTLAVQYVSYSLNPRKTTSTAKLIAPPQLGCGGLTLAVGNTRKNKKDVL